jgi:cell division protein FtsL
VFSTSIFRRYLITAILLSSLLFSAVLSVQNSHVSRQSFYQLQNLRKEQKQLQTQYGQLLLEQAALSAPARIEQAIQKQEGEKQLIIPDVKHVVLVQ